MTTRFHRRFISPPYGRAKPTGGSNEQTQAVRDRRPRRRGLAGGRGRRPGHAAAKIDTVQGAKADQARSAAVQYLGSGRAGSVELDSEHGATYDVEVHASDGSVDGRLAGRGVQADQL